LIATVFYVFLDEKLSVDITQNFTALMTIEKEIVIVTNDISVTVVVFFPVSEIYFNGLINSGLDLLFKSHSLDLLSLLLKNELEAC